MRAGHKSRQISCLETGLCHYLIAVLRNVSWSKTNIWTAVKWGEVFFGGKAAWSSAAESSQRSDGFVFPNNSKESLTVDGQVASKLLVIFMAWFYSQMTGPFDACHSSSLLISHLSPFYWNKATEIPQNVTLKKKKLQRSGQYFIVNAEQVFKCSKINQHQTKWTKTPFWFFFLQPIQQSVQECHCAWQHDKLDCPFWMLRKLDETQHETTNRKANFERQCGEVESFHLLMNKTSPGRTRTDSVGLLLFERTVWQIAHCLHCFVAEYRDTQTLGSKQWQKRDTTKKKMNKNRIDGCS